MGIGPGYWPCWVVMLNSAVVLKSHGESYYETALNMKIKEDFKPSMWSLYDQDRDNFDIFHTESCGFGSCDTDTRYSDFPAKDKVTIGWKKKIIWKD